MCTDDKFKQARGEEVEGIPWPLDAVHEVIEGGKPDAAVPVRGATRGRFAAVSVVDELRDALGGHTEDGGYVGAAQPGAAQPAGHNTRPCG